MATTNSDFLPNETGLNLGSPDQRWDGFFDNIVVNQTINGIPTVDGVRVVTTSQTLAFGFATNLLILATGGAGIALALPVASLFSGQVIKIKKTDLTAGAVNITSADLIDGAGSYALTNQYQYVNVEAGNGTWQVVGNN